MAESMGAEQARADVAALFAAIERAQAAAQRVEAVFLATSGSLKGQGGDKGDAAGHGHRQRHLAGGAVANRWG